MTQATTRPRRDLAERVRQACLTAAGDAYEDAGLRGLCAEGRWECARQAVASLDLEAIVRDEPSAVSFETPADLDSGNRA